MAPAVLLTGGSPRRRGELAAHGSGHHDRMLTWTLDEPNPPSRRASARYDRSRVASRIRSSVRRRFRPADAVHRPRVPLRSASQGRTASPQHRICAGWPASIAMSARTGHQPHLTHTTLISRASTGPVTAAPPCPGDGQSPPAPGRRSPPALPPHWRRPERAYRTHWVSPTLSEAKRRRLAERQSQPADLVVAMPLKDWTCTDCAGTGDLLIMEGPGPLCLACADLDHLVYLPSGDAALTRRAKKASGLSAVLVRFSRTRRRREREEARRADRDLAFDAAMAAVIVRLFPGCPTTRAETIAHHAGARGSGRVGRSAAGRALDPRAVTLAVAASVRHEDTGYDELLMSDVPRRDEAREQVRSEVQRILASSQAPEPC